MVSKTLSTWILITFFSCALCDTETYGPCMILHLDGTCIPITSCKFAMTILSLNDVQTLRSMFCGFEGSFPNVCCPISSMPKKPTAPKRIDTTTVTNIETTSARNTETTSFRNLQTTSEKYRPTVTPPLEYKLVDNEVVTGSPFIPKSSLLPNRDVCGLLTGQDRIFGGDITDIDENPWLVRIKSYNPTRHEELYICSGSLISDRYVLTAAHCVTVYKPVYVRLGEWDTETNVDCQEDFCNDGPIDVKIEQVIVHPGYDRRNVTSSDIALLRLENRVKFTDFVRPVCLPTTDYIARQDYIDSTFKTVGWGMTEFGQASVLPRKVNIDAVPYSTCITALPVLTKTDDPNVICAGGKQGKDSCQGDSGGPLLRIERENYKQNWFLYGITSYGVKNCASAGKPAIYTRVSKYMDWILQTIR